MNLLGITPPTMLSTNSYPAPRASGEIRIQQSPYWPRPPHDLAHDLAPPPGPGRRDPDPAVAVLAPPAALLLVLPLALGEALDGLPVRHLRAHQLGVDAVLPL